MLEAFASRLRAEVERPNENLDRYLSRFVRADELKDASRVVSLYVLGLPDNINLLNAFLMAGKTPLVVKMFYASVLAYLLNPKDFLPEESYRLYGYLDDAYLVACALHRTLGHIPRSMREKQKDEIARMEAQRDLTAKVRDYLPPVVLEKLNAALDSFELAAFVICDQSKVGEVQSALGSRFSTLSDED
ncbi:MAG: DUF1232 domain-containing protein [Armatimonadetes bacterium]|nr:DUF1232 domain-containing protein [Armatimonadota bacterium]